MLEQFSGNNFLKLNVCGGNSHPHIYQMLKEFTESNTTHKQVLWFLLAREVRTYKKVAANFNRYFPMQGLLFTELSHKTIGGAKAAQLDHHFSSLQARFRCEIHFLLHGWKHSSAKVQLKFS